MLSGADGWEAIEEFGKEKLVVVIFEVIE